ncbi:MAG: hypothetical protein OXG24_02715 [Gammaproteobacteria bacterium]|nr:hypothetical protein [Gammaproteobacteria bacterium]
MFNNPFESFHNTVAEAKDEREQLDQLLTISTPRERLLLALIFLFVATLSVWLTFGVWSHTVSIHGFVLAEADDHGSEILIVSMIHRNGGLDVNEVQAGMRATARIELGQDRAQVVSGTVRKLDRMTLIPNPDASMNESISTRRAEIALDSRLDATSIAGKKCTFVIDLGHRSPLEIFLTTLL